MPPRTGMGSKAHRPRRGRVLPAPRTTRHINRAHVWGVLLAVFAVVRLADWYGSRAGAEANAPVVAVNAPLAAVPVGALTVPAPPVATSPGAPASLAAARPHIRMHSRLTGDSAEVWGTTTAVDGSTVRIAARSEHGRYRFLGDAPVSDGTFHARAGVPSGLTGKPLWISTTLVP